jgi:hypothetical protein
MEMSLPYIAPGWAPNRVKRAQARSEIESRVFAGVSDLESATVYRVAGLKPSQSLSIRMYVDNAFRP